MCGGERALYWQIVLYFFIIVPQIVGVILAFRTRKVHIKALNDSKYLAVIIYTTAVIVTIMIIGAIILDRFLTIDAAVFGGLLTLFATVLLGLTFIPKVSEWKYVFLHLKQYYVCADGHLVQGS